MDKLVRQRVRRFVFSFPIQLVVVQAKKNHFQLLYWLLLFCFVGELLMARNGVPYLFRPGICRPGKLFFVLPYRNMSGCIYYCLQHFQLFIKQSSLSISGFIVAYIFQILFKQLYHPHCIHFFLHV